MAFTTRHSVLVRIREGDDVGWEQFYPAYRPLIRLRGRDHGLAAAECDDLVQDVMLSIFRGQVLFRFDPDRGRFRDYFRRIVDRRAVDILRKRPSDVSEADLGTRIRAVSDDHEAMERSWETAWRRHVLAQALAAVREQVHDTTFQAFIMVTEQCVPPDEVAERLGISVDSVYQAKHRVLARVRKIIEDEA